MIDPKTHAGLAWRKSIFCANQACVEVAQLEDGSVAVRDSKRPDGPPLVFTLEEWSEFLAGIARGEFKFA
jgi:hypothetical protein